jgi:hypothetical protein
MALFEAERTVRKLTTNARLRGMRILASVEGLSPALGEHGWMICP